MRLSSQYLCGRQRRKDLYPVYCVQYKQCATKKEVVLFFIFG